jgi:hypothetical protein
VDLTGYLGENFQGSKPDTLLNTKRALELPAGHEACTYSGLQRARLILQRIYSAYALYYPNYCARPSYTLISLLIIEAIPSLQRLYHDINAFLA